MGGALGFLFFGALFVVCVWQAHRTDDGIWGMYGWWIGFGLVLAGLNQIGGPNP